MKLESFWSITLPNLNSSYIACVLVCIASTDSVYSILMNNINEIDKYIIQQFKNNHTIQTSITQI